ncbi:MAG: hypothetical protein RLZZ484_879, partial [Pseudomonadota bacterium]
VLMVFALPLQRLWGWAMGQRSSNGAVSTPVLPTHPDRA